MQRVWQLPPRSRHRTARPRRRPAAEAVGPRSTSCASGSASLRDRYPQNGALALTGHAHIDLAWLWPLEETRRKAKRTFHTMVGLMDRHPEFRFNQSTAQLYAFLEEDDPALLRRASRRRWRPASGSRTAPCGSSPTPTCRPASRFVRQLLYGQRYFERTFGKRHTVCWLPDCFGFSPALPQLLLQAGVTSFFTIKVNWNETNTIPHDLFWWEGLDGSRVLAHTFDNPVGGYNAEIGPRAIVETWKNFRGKHRHPESLLAFGFGDGGGGPTEEMLDRQRQFADFPVVPALRPVAVADWFAEVRDAVGDDPDLPVWVGEMYLELHRGTLTTQGRTKFLHRRAERALITAETLSSMATLLGEPVAGSLEDQWRVLLRNEFHDILPGSSIREVYELAEAELGSVVAEGERVAGRPPRRDRRAHRPAGRHARRARRQPRPLAAAAPARPRPSRCRAARPSRAAASSPATAPVPGLTAAVVVDAPPRAGPERRLRRAGERR